VSGLSITLDEATPLLEQVKTEAAAKGLALVAARAVGVLVKGHLYGLDAQRHEYGNHYYRQAGDSLTTGLVPRGAVLSVTQTGFRQRLYGGTIRAKNVRNLTIPACPEAVGHRAGEFNDLDFGFALNPKTDALQPALIRRAQTTIRISRHKQKDGTVKFTARPVADLHPQVMFWLTPSITQRADPSVLPHDEQMAQVASDAVKKRMIRLALRNTQQSAPENPSDN